MPGQQPPVAVESFDNDTIWVVRLPETLFDYDEEPIFSRVFPGDTGRGRSLILDFGEVKGINGLGADMLVKLCARVTMKGGSVSAFNLPDGMGDVFKVSELDQAIGLFGTYEEALSAAGIRDRAYALAEHRGEPTPIDTGCWAKPVALLSLPNRVEGARNLNVDGRRVVGPVNGFGRLWQKIFRLYIKDKVVTPEEAIDVLKHHFPSFQPSFNRFFPSPAGIAPGEIVLIDSMTPGGPVSTGVMVLYADDRSFTFACPQGHPESGFVTFSAFEDGGDTVVQVLGLARANDPVYEGAFRFVGSKIQSRIWTHLLSSLAAYLGVPANVVLDGRSVDGGVRWDQAKNIWYNAQIGTMLGEPIYLLKRLFKSSRGKEAGAGR